MKIELVKNKHTNIIEKIILNKRNKIEFKDISNLELKHEDTLVLLNDYQTKWHEIFINYNVNSDLIFIKNELHKDFNNREVNFIFNRLKDYHNENFNFNNNFTEFDRWFFNYYMWTIFFVVVEGLIQQGKINLKGKIVDQAVKVVDPSILFLIEGVNYCEPTTLFKDFKKSDEILNILWNIKLTEDKDDVFKKLKSMDFNNKELNLFMFEREILKFSDFENKNKILWNLKKNLINSMVLEFIEEQLHYTVYKN